MADDITCNVCGGTNFFIEAGHYYCAECQTQSQDIREHVFATPDETTAARQTSFKRIQTEKKVVDQLTSWECYNYIILGLVNELIELGADSKLKKNVHCLWFKYLRTLEVVSDKSGAAPKLSAVNSQRDAEIIYGRSKKKRRRSRTPSPSGTSSSDPSTMDTSTLRRERSKQKRSMLLAQYDEFSNTQQSEDVSLHNQSLVSLRSGSDTSKDKEKFLKYNRSAKKEILKIMTKNHLKAHCRDVSSLLDCHKLAYRCFTSKYVHGAKVLSRNKVYAIIYLGLLINKDKIQLGDLLRFIREGKLSYHDVWHFFPEDFDQKNLNIKNWNRGNTLLSHYTMRKVTADIAKQIGVSKYVPRQNLVQLCQRYCAELNLPDQVWGYSLNLMSRAVPQMHLTEKSKAIPNYEGRVISIIIFVLKLFFGLDEATEEKFSTYAETVNNLNHTSTDVTQEKMFVWKDWAYYINYRKLVLMQHHFPTQYLFDNENVHNSDLFINFMTEQNMKHEKDDPLTREAEVLKQLLERLQDRQPSPKKALDFKTTLTPFRDYVEILLDSEIPEENNYLTEILKLSFKNDSFNFLIDPLSYLEELNKNSKVGIKHRGANNNMKIIKIPNFKVKRECWRNAAKQTVFVKLSDNCALGNTERSTDFLQETKNVEELNTRQIIKNFEQRHMKSYKKNLKRLKKAYEKKGGNAQIQEEYSFAMTSQRAAQLERELSESMNSRCNLSQETSQEINTSQENNTSQFQERQATGVGSQETQSSQRLNYIHYNPYDRYWMKCIDAANISKEEFQGFIQTFPDSFQMLLNECARVTEQSPKSLFEEFTVVEIYLCFVAEFTYKDKFRDKVVNNDLVRFINKAKKNW